MAHHQRYRRRVVWQPYDYEAKAKELITELANGHGIYIKWERGNPTFSTSGDGSIVQSGGQFFLTTASITMSPQMREVLKVIAPLLKAYIPRRNRR